MLHSNLSVLFECIVLVQCLCQCPATISYIWIRPYFDGIDHRSRGQSLVRNGLDLSSPTLEFSHFLVTIYLFTHLVLYVSIGNSLAVKLND